MRVFLLVEIWVLNLSKMTLALSLECMTRARCWGIVWNPAADEAVNVKAMGRSSLNIRRALGPQ